MKPIFCLSPFHYPLKKSNFARKGMFEHFFLFSLLFINRREKNHRKRVSLSIQLSFSILHLQQLILKDRDKEWERVSLFNCLILSPSPCFKSVCLPLSSSGIRNWASAPSFLLPLPLPVEIVYTRKAIFSSSSSCWLLNQRELMDNNFKVDWKYSIQLISFPNH